MEDAVKELRPQLCYQCMKCSSGCTAAKVVNNYRPHEIVALVKAGYSDELINSDVIWACSVCLKCVEYCPQRVSPFEVVMALRNESIARGRVPPKSFVEMAKSVLKVGHIQEPMYIMSKDFEEVSRMELGLPEMPKPKDFEKFKQHVLLVGFEKLKEVIRV
ncbi:MAG: 4Fe-4S dicluster domain-containing protein [Nitrososphaerota archaeon]